jgi:hypothetical protein
MEIWYVLLRYALNSTGRWVVQGTVRSEGLLNDHTGDEVAKRSSDNTKG